MIVDFTEKGKLEKKAPLNKMFPDAKKMFS